jgi:hypothetical protein
LKHLAAILTLLCCAVLASNAQTEHYRAHTALFSSGNLNGIWIGADRNYAVDRENKFMVFSGLRSNISYGNYEATNELSIRRSNDSLADVLNSETASITASLNLYFGLRYQLNEKWNVVFSGDLVGIGIGSTTSARLEPGAALLNSGRTDIQNALVERIEPQLLNLFVPLNRSRGSLQGDLSLQYQTKNKGLISIGALLLLRGYETGAVGAKGSKFFRQTSWLPVISYTRPIKIKEV